jgi:hypothetical protein
MPSAICLDAVIRIQNAHRRRVYRGWERVRTTDRWEREKWPAWGAAVKIVIEAALATENMCDRGISTGNGQLAQAGQVQLGRPLLTAGRADDLPPAGCDNNHRPSRQRVRKRLLSEELKPRDRQRSGDPRTRTRAAAADSSSSGEGRWRRMQLPSRYDGRRERATMTRTDSCRGQARQGEAII